MTQPRLGQGKEVDSIYLSGRYSLKADQVLGKAP